MKKRPGRRSAASLAIVPTTGSGPHLLPPETLDGPSQALWRAIVASRPADYFSPGDLPLLREYVHTCACLLPLANGACEREFNPKTLDARDRLLKSAALLATRLRLCVSSRTRPDAAAMRDSVKRTPALDWDAYLAERDRGTD